LKIIEEKNIFFELFQQKIYYLWSGVFRKIQDTLMQQTAQASQLFLTQNKSKIDAKTGWQWGSAVRK